LKKLAWFATSLIVASTIYSVVTTNAAWAQTHGQHTNHEAMNGTDNAQRSGASPYAAMAGGTCQEPSLNCARSATPAFAPDGSLWLVWSGGGAVSASRSTDLGKTFGPRIEIAKHDAFLDSGPDSRPQIVIDKDDQIAIAYGFFKDKQWNAQVNIATSKDQGRTFSPAHALVTDPASQRFPNLTITPSGALFATWIDKRVVAEYKKRGEKAEGGSIAYAWSKDMGTSFEPESIAQKSSCECCRIAVDLNNKGMPVLLYRAIFDGTTRDHASQVFSSQDKPGPINKVADDNWVTNSCPHHGPTVAVSSIGTLHAAWFTQGTNRVGTFYARSTDGGNHYSAPRQLGSPETLSGRPYLLALGKNIWLVWKNFDGKQASILLQTSKDDGVTWSAPKEIAKTQGYSDHPLLIKNNNKVYLSWLTSANGYQLLQLND